MILYYLPKQSLWIMHLYQIPTFTRLSLLLSTFTQGISDHDLLHICTQSAFFHNDKAGDNAVAFKRTSLPSLAYTDPYEGEIITCIHSYIHVPVTLLGSVQEGVANVYLV